MVGKGGEDMDYGYRHIPPFAGYTDFTPFVPKLYWDVYSQEQRMHALCEQAHKIICYCNMLGIEVDKTLDDIESLEAEFEQFKESGFSDYYEQQLEQWINDNAALLFTKLARMVFFGLTLDGHFVAYIPESWDDIVFDTGADYTLDTYGRLMLRWDADSPDNVDQRPEVVRPITDDELEQKIRNIMNTLYAIGG